MNRSTWKSILGFVELDNYPDLPCPLCGSVSLNFDKETVQYRPLTKNHEDLVSRHHQLELQRINREKDVVKDGIKDLYDSSPILGIVCGVAITLEEMKAPQTTFEQFNAFLVCHSCQGEISCSGLKKKFVSKNKNEHEKVSTYKIDYFSAPIPIFNIGEDVPDSIRAELSNAFHCFHFDTNASAHKLRKAIEAFCIELGTQRNNLARQIKELSQNYPTEAKLLNALRLVGNEGTHSTGVDEEDLLNAFDIIEEVIQIFRKLKKLKDLEVPTQLIENKFKKLTANNV